MGTPNGDPIDRVINRLEELIAWALSQPSRVGYFASLYLRVTNTIQAKIGTGYFDDDVRMQALDAMFASRYLSAAEQFRTQDPALPAAWALAFDATKQETLIIVQHLMLAMNAHINIDLAVAAAGTCPGESIDGLRADFMKINVILSGLVPTVMTEVGDLSPVIHLLDDLAEPAEIPIIDFSMTAARDAAWSVAKRLARLSATEQENVIAAENVIVSALGQKIIAPDPIADQIVGLIRAKEAKDIVQIIRTLNSGDLISERSAVPTPPAEAAVGESAANRVYYFGVAPGAWTGEFRFELTSWRALWSSSMSLKNKLLATAMAVFQGIFGDSSIFSELTAYPDRGAFGIAFNEIRISKWWFPLWRSYEQYTLNPDGHRVRVEADVNFGPISFLFREHDVYPATVYDGGMRNLYHIKLLGTRFLGKYQVQPDRLHVESLLANEWASAHETITQVGGPKMH